MCFCRSLIIKKENKENSNEKCKMENQRKAEKQNM